ncbi:MAG: transcriptional repressor LexA [Bavariicoccus seileri]|uniref:LexA repressor n=1 Tax=Bavariicoccus seileri TaxID=549685 RepID=A0A3D4S3I4_9ENTE|nr:transcriptional repressor LexA [Bavariicoccus seileri]HCS93310.1 transcriptional repressor LexA [Bavariicoccus seileri]
MVKGLTNRQINILSYIYDAIKTNGYPPTVREICQAVDLASTSTVHGHLDRLEQKGYLERDKSKPRAMELTSFALKALGIQPAAIPLIGTVTAGEPILAVEDATDYFPTPPEFMNDTTELFMLTIRGESMINAGIFDGDQVIIRKTSSAKNGDIVIAMTDEDEATCKRFYREKGYVRLQPENDTMDPIILDNVTILGKVVGLYRSHVF